MESESQNKPGRLPPDLFCASIETKPLLQFFILIWIAALREDAFEKPFYAILYYFLWSVMIRLTRHLGQAVKGWG